MADPRRVRLGLRIVLTGVLAIAGGVIVVMVTFLTVAGAVFGWLWAATVFVAWGVGAVLLGVPRTMPGARVRAAVVVGVIVGLLGVYVAHEAPPRPSRLREAIGHLDLPAGWTPSGDDIGGNSLCFDVCYSVTRSYQALRPDPRLISATRAQLRERGLVRRDRDGEPKEYFFGTRGDVDFAVTIDEENWKLFVTAQAK